MKSVRAIFYWLWWPLEEPLIQGLSCRGEITPLIWGLDVNKHFCHTHRAARNLGTISESLFDLRLA